MTLKELRELINSYPLNDDDTLFELYNDAGELITDPVDIHEDFEYNHLGGDRILIFG